MNWKKTTTIFFVSLIIISVLPFAIDLFEQAGGVLLGYEAFSSSPYLPTFVAYLPLLVLLFIYINAMLVPVEHFGLKLDTGYLVPALIVGVLSAVLIFLIDVYSGTLDSFGVPLNPSVAVALGFIISWGLLAPFVEELLFRGFIQSAFQEAIGGKWVFHPAILLASFFEVLLHLGYPLYFTQQGTVSATAVSTVPQLLYVALFGAIGGWFYSKTGSLLPPFIIHAVGNAGELVLLWLFA